MHTGPVVAVRGEISHEVEPEIARIEVSVAATALVRSDARRMLTERGAIVDRILGEFAEVIEKTESSGPRLNPQLPARPGNEQPAGYHGVIHYAVTVTGFERLGELMAELSKPEMTEVGGPWWNLRPDSPVYREARIAAVSDAIQRARDYAAAVGSQLAGLIELADAHLLSEARSPAEPRPLSASSARLPHRPRATPQDEPVFDLSPARQQVRATIEARFVISEPDLLR